VSRVPVGPLVKFLAFALVVAVATTVLGLTIDTIGPLDQVLAYLQGAPLIANERAITRSARTPSRRAISKFSAAARIARPARVR